jgi:hypothetical protein
MTSRESLLREIDDVPDSVTAIEYRGGYVFRVTFDDGAAGDVDFSEYPDLGPVFIPLRDLSYFRQARIEGGTIAWPNGADIAPETLYEKVEAAESAHTSVARDKPATQPPRRRTRKP